MWTPGSDYMASILCNVLCSVAVTERLEGKTTLFSVPAGTSWVERSKYKWLAGCVTGTLLGASQTSRRGRKAHTLGLNKMFLSAALCPSSAPSNIESALAENRGERVRCHLHQTKEWGLHVSSVCAKKKLKYLQRVQWDSGLRGKKCRTLTMYY